MGMQMLTWMDCPAALVPAEEPMKAILPERTRSRMVCRSGRVEARVRVEDGCRARLNQARVLVELLEEPEAVAAAHKERLWAPQRRVTLLQQGPAPRPTAQPSQGQPRGEWSWTRSPARANGPVWRP